MLIFDGNNGIDMADKPITNVDVGVLPENAVNKQYMDAYAGGSSGLSIEDKTKLDEIEDGATADQSAEEIKIAYESNADTNALTDTLLALLTTKKVKNITTDALNNKLVITYTDDTVANLNISDTITDIHVSGATLDATTNVLTLTSTDGGADVTVDLSDFVNSGELTSALSGKADKIHSHSTSDITGLDATLSNLAADLNNKQDNLVSGTNIKTINGQSVLGSGNIVITGGGSGGGLSIEDKTKLDGIEEEATKNKTDGFLLSRSNHTGLQSMNTISGLAESLSAKADINTVYAEPMSTNYTTRNEIVESIKTIKYPLNGVNNNYALHAFALKELPIGKEVLSLNTVLMGSGYYGVKIPRIANTQLSFPNTSEPFKRMTTHNQYGQTISATNEYNASYAAWKLFSAGDTGTAADDAWHSAGTLTPSTPVIVTFTSPNVFSMSSYKMVNRNGASASPRAWRIEGRVGSSGNWELIHEVVDYTGNTPSLARVFNIPEENRKACDQHRLVILKSNSEPYATLARLIIYKEPSKFMIEDGVNKYRSTSTGFSLSYTPMTKHSEHNQVISATSEYNATYVAWKVLLAGNTTSDITDCWASIAAPTALSPQTITIDFGQPKKIYSYSIINRWDAANNAAGIASPSSWAIEVRNNLLDDWVAIDSIQGDKDNNSLSVRNFSIAEEKRGEWRYFRIVIKDRNGPAAFTCISRLRIYGDLIGEELELVPNVITKNDITLNGTSNSVIITKQKLSTLSNPYIITDEPSSIELTIDSEKEYEYSNNVKIALVNTYIKFTATESGKYKFCYQEPAPVIP